MSETDEESTTLEVALQEQRHVRIHRTLRHAYPMDSFVLAIGTKWALITETLDGGYLDGTTAIRIRDISNVVPNRSFEERFARTQSTWPPTAPDEINLDKTSRLITSLGATAPLIGIEQEDRYKSAVKNIGHIEEVGSGYLWLHEVTPKATWTEDAWRYKLSRITKVTVSDGYQTALAAVACEDHD